MNKLPVIVSFGGYNAAGRSSFHHAFRRTVLESLDNAQRTSTFLSLASLMGLVSYAQGSYLTESGEALSAEQVEWQHIQQVLKYNNGNVSATARQLSMHRRTLQRKLQKMAPQIKD